MTDKKRLIVDAECAQSKCARPTTGCWGECSLKRNPVVYANSTNIVAAYAVATQPAPVPAQTEQQASRNSALRAEPAGQHGANERALFEKSMNDARFFPAELCFARTKSLSGRDEYANSHLQSCWVGWQARAKQEPSQATRCRAEGGNTCTEGSSLLAGNALTDEAKDAVVEAASKLIKAKGRYHTEKSYKVLAENLARAVLASHVKAGQAGNEPP